MSDDRDSVVSGFASHMQGLRITEERSKEICRAVETLPLSLATKNAICDEVVRHIVKRVVYERLSPKAKGECPPMPPVKSPSFLKSIPAGCPAVLEKCVWSTVYICPFCGILSGDKLHPPAMGIGAGERLSPKAKG